MINIQAHQAPNIQTEKKLYPHLYAGSSSPPNLYPTGDQHVMALAAELPSDPAIWTPWLPPSIDGGKMIKNISADPGRRDQYSNLM